MSCASLAWWSAWYSPRWASPAWGGRGYYPYVLGPGITLVALGIVFPRVLKPVYIAWMALAFTLGFLVSHLILGVLFYAVITPMGFVARLAGKDFLRVRRDPAASSYWIPRERQAPPAPANYERQY